MQLCLLWAAAPVILLSLYMKPLATAVDMDTGIQSSACGAEAWAACAEPWPLILASGSLVRLCQHKLWAQLPGALRELGGYWWGHFIQCLGITDPSRPAEGQRKSSTC